MKQNILEQLRGGLVVSCQARPGNPLRGADHMAAMAAAAELGGAVAFAPTARMILLRLKKE